MSRAKMLLVLILCFTVGIAGFLVDYFVNSNKWVFAEGSPHIYVSDKVETVGCGLIAEDFFKRPCPACSSNALGR